MTDVRKELIEVLIEAGKETYDGGQANFNDEAQADAILKRFKLVNRNDWEQFDQWLKTGVIGNE